MITAPDGSWRYLGPPKTASTLLTELLQQPPYGGEYSGSQHDMKHLDGAKMIVSVRSPWTRAPSLWGHYRVDLGRKGGRAFHDPPRYRPYRADEVPFVEFMRLVVTGSLDSFYSYSLTQWLTWTNEWHAVLHQESLAADLRTCFPDIAVPELFLLNRNMVYVPPDLYDDPEAVELVQQWAVNDFEVLGYPSDPPAA